MSYVIVVIGGVGPPSTQKAGPTGAQSGQARKLEHPKPSITQTQGVRKGSKGPDMSGGALQHRKSSAVSNPRACRQWRLLADRVNQGLLVPFVCSNCGVLALDSLGWNGPRLPLCGRCADGEVAR